MSARLSRMALNRTYWKSNLNVNVACLCWSVPLKGPLLQSRSNRPQTHAKVHRAFRYQRGRGASKTSMFTHHKVLFTPTRTRAYLRSPVGSRSIGSIAPLIAIDFHHTHPCEILRCRNGRFARQPGIKYPKIISAFPNSADGE